MWNNKPYGINKFNISNLITYKLQPFGAIFRGSAVKETCLGNVVDLSIIVILVRVQKVKLSLQQAAETHRFVRRRGSHIF
jgi:hypothetical protein